MKSVITLCLGCFLSVDMYAQFGPRTDIAVGLHGAYEIQVADLDSDGLPDVVMLGQNVVAWARNLGGSMSFAPLDTIYLSTWSNWANSMVVCDINGDGHMDVVLADRQLKLVLWLENINGTGNFADPVLVDDIGDHDGSGAIMCQDLSGDALPEVAVNLNGGITRWRTNIGGNFGAPDSLVYFEGGPPSPVLLAGDIDLDGSTDLVTTDWNGYLTGWLNDGAGNEFTDTLLAQPFYYYGKNFQILDMEGDGDLDIVDAQNSSKWAENLIVGSDGLTTFPIHPIEGTGVASGWAAHMGCGSGASVFTVWEPDDDIMHWAKFDPAISGFSQSIEIQLDPGIKLIRSADMNGDGMQDLLVAHSDSIISWYANQLPLLATGSVDLTPFDTLCAFGSSYDLDHATPTGGTWSGGGVANNSFDPPGEGTFELIYTVQVPGGCPLVATQDIVVVGQPEVTLVSGDAGNSCGVDPLVYEAMPANGTWSGIADENGVVDRSCAARPDAGPVIYTFDAANGSTGCSATTENFQLLPCLTIDLGPDLELCANADTLVITVGGPFNGGSSLIGLDSLEHLPPATSVGYFYPGHDTVEYMITGSVFGAGACSAFDTLLITVLPVPDPQILSDLSFCEGELEGEIMADMAGDFGGSATGNSTTTGTVDIELLGEGEHGFTFEVIDGNGCTAEITGQIEIFVAPEVNYELEYPFFALSDPESILEEGYPPGGYFTLNDSPDVITTIDPAALGIGSDTIFYHYQDTITGCWGSDPEIIHIGTVGINDAKAAPYIRFIPNPARDHVQVWYTGHETRITLRDATGRMIGSWNSLASPLIIDLGAYAAGRYLISVQNEAQTRSAILIIHE